VQFIISGLESELYEKETDRIAAYWALSKTFDKNLIPNLKSWLKSELENEKSTAVFQILIALDRLDEPVFPGNRTGQAYNEVELNYKYAKNYLKIK
jgi:HEAT repeat protein